MLLKLARQHPSLPGKLVHLRKRPLISERVSIVGRTWRLDPGLIRSNVLANVYSPTERSTPSTLRNNGRNKTRGRIAAELMHCQTSAGHGNYTLANYSYLFISLLLRYCRAREASRGSECLFTHLSSVLCGLGHSLFTGTQFKILPLFRISCL